MLRTNAACLAILTVGAVGIAQDQKAPPQERTERPQIQNRQNERPAQPGQARRERAATSDEVQGVEGALADCLILANQEEIALLQFAQERSKNDDVKKFTKMAIQDHQKAIGELGKFGTGQAGDLEVAATRDAAPATKAAPERREVTARKPATGSAGQDTTSQKMLTIEKQARQECLAMTKEQLGKEDGEKFDACFLGQQVGMHIGMSSKLKAIQNNTSGEFQQLAEKLGETAKEHKQHAEKLLKDLESAEKKK